MATYCKNHVEEEIKRLKPNAKNGKVKKIPTKEGTCGHLGGCNTDNLELCRLEYEYQPSESEVEIAKSNEAEAKAAKEEELKTIASNMEVGENNVVSNESESKPETEAVDTEPTDVATPEEPKTQ